MNRCQDSLNEGLTARAVSSVFVVMGQGIAVVVEPL